jgi:serine/threonine protein kinase
VKAKPVEVKGLQRYTLLRTIGTGAFARVRLAIDKVTTEVVVVKVISKGMVVRKKQLDHVMGKGRYWRRCSTLS